MANRYILKGATFNGDGTTSAEAASAGAAGAWNDITYFEGVTPAYGTLPAGTTVYIRSKDAAGAAITITFSAAKTLGAGSGVGTELSPITWVIDDGTVWSGVSATVTYQATSQATVTLRDYNNFIATNYNFVILGWSGWNVANFVQIGKCLTRDVCFDISSCTGNAGAVVIDSGTHLSPKFRYTGRYAGCVTGNNNHNCPVLYNPKFELLAIVTGYPIVSIGGFDQRLTIYGGEIYGIGAGDNVPIAKVEGYGGGINIYGLKHPISMLLSTPAMMASLQSYAYINGADGVLGNTYFDYNFSLNSRNDGNFPTLNASLETSAALPWSYKVSTHNTSVCMPAKISTSKMWTQAAAAKTVTMELLWPTTLAAPTKEKVYAVVQYTDNATGLKVQQTTMLTGTAALDVSTAGWAGATFGAQMGYGTSRFDKYRMSLTTSGSIKQDTEVLVTVLIAPRAASVLNDIIFVCPDPTFS